MKKEFVTQLIILIVELMFSRIRVGDTSFHLLSAERFANSSDSKRLNTYNYTNMLSNIKKNQN